MARRDLTFPLLAGLGAALGLAFMQRRTIMLFGSKALDAAREGIFKATLPARAKPYGTIILQVAREQGLDPYLIFALGDRESQWGEALSPKGPGGKGDFGHGHGLMQIDDRSFGPWLASNPWWDPYVNVTKGAQVLKGKLAFFQGRSAVPGTADGQGRVFIDKSAARLGVSPGAYADPRPLSGDALWRAAISAYNTGEGNVLLALAAGRSSDTTTAGGDYMTDVIARASALARSVDNASV